MTHDAPDAVTDEIARLRGVLTRCRTVLGNMALENEGWLSFFKRWPISHEPLRSDARHLVPLIDEALALAPSAPDPVMLAALSALKKFHEAGKDITRHGPTRWDSGLVDEAWRDAAAIIARAEGTAP